jgi:hypothetical protein
MDQTSLTGSFAKYIASGRNTETNAHLCEALREAGFASEALGLELYRKRGPGATYVFQEPPWIGRQCYVGERPPNGANFGDLWLDVVELSVSVRIRNIPDTSMDGIGWIGTHPVWLWQYCAFLQLARVRRFRIEWAGPDDFLTPDRFGEYGARDYASNVYREEASAYSVWFDRFLCHQLDFANAKHSVPAMAFAAIMPPSMRLWDRSTDSDWLAFAVCVDPEERIAHDEGRIWTKAHATPGLPSVGYEEWARSQGIAYSTIVYDSSSLSRGLTNAAQCAEYIEFGNSAFNVEGN